MSIRLYDGAWVNVEGAAQPLKVSKDKQNPGLFHVGDAQYDIDARAYRTTPDAPAILSILSLQATKAAGLRSDYY